MNDISALGIQFRGYPVTVMSDGVLAAMAPAIMASTLTTQEVTGKLLLAILAAARDTAAADEPSGWLFGSQLAGQTVWIERWGGMRTTDGHEGAEWSVYLPAER